MYESGVSRSEVNSWFYRTCLQNVEVKSIKTIASEWLAYRLEQSEFFIQEIVDIIKLCVSKGICVIIATGSFREVVEPIALTVGARHIICAPLEEKNGVYTGRLTSEPTIESGKKDAVIELMHRFGVSPSACYGYGDHHSDIPFLAELGDPHIVSSGSEIALNHALENDWKIVEVYQ